MAYYIGVDIGGTKCAVCLGQVEDGMVTILHRCNAHPTANHSVTEMLKLLLKDSRACIVLSPEKPKAMGISCGSPMDSKRGRILSPPNLIGWDDVPITDYMSEKLGIPAYLCNDANACALAEWRMGAGRGTENMLFLTFGTGLGAGLILGGRLYEGTTDSAGECGHIRLSGFGPTGYGKMGSFEGFCSGGGIAQLAQMMVREQLQQGKKPALCPAVEQLSELTAAKVAQFANLGDPLALEIYEKVGTMLGYGLSILIDILNPQKIVIGSIFTRAQNLLWPAAEKVIRQETLPAAQAACEVVPAGLTESVGDIAALTVASYRFETDPICNQEVFIQ